MERIRVRFAPSPTGPLHIGGVRTALYTYLIARKYGGDFVLRIEDTDQKRYVPGAEDYIADALTWCGIIPDESPVLGGDYGPYRQSERKEIYRQYAEELVSAGKAYYAFDSADDLAAMRTRYESEGIHSPKYDANTRTSMKNSLTLSEAEVEHQIANSEDCIIRLKVEPGHEIKVNDLIRGEVVFQSKELDDKVLLKADGMPTYHMANIVDDRLMKISHVIRGEEWLSSTAHHVLLYRGLGWEDEMPKFAHLPLILKPNGKGKLSKRDGAKFGFPVFPLSWEGETAEDSFIGFRAFGFDPKATINFLAFLGWNPGSEQEIFSLKELISNFSLEQIVKSGARFDIDKARWFNQQYIIAEDDTEIARYLKEFEPKHYGEVEEGFLLQFVALMKERVELYPDFYKKAYYFFEEVKEYEEKMVRKKWNEDRAGYIKDLTEIFANSEFEASALKAELEKYMAEKEIGFGDVMPFLRIALTGTTKGPDLFETLSLLGKERSEKRLAQAIIAFNEVVATT